PVAAIGEIVAEDGELMRLPELLKFGEREGVPVITIAALIEWLNTHHCDGIPEDIEAPTEFDRVQFEVETSVPTAHGVFRIRPYRDRSTGADPVAIIKGDLADDSIVRVHSECLTGEAFGSLK